MSLEYAEKKIEEALERAGGSAIRARQIIIAQALEDPKLLQALTKNHLTGIAAYHVDRVESGRAAKARAKAQKPAPAQPPQAPANASEEEFGMEILKAVAASGAEVFGLENTGRPQKRGQASQNHINALKAMAAKSSPPKKSDE